MTNLIKYNSSIEKDNTSSINKYIQLEFYVVWDIKEKRFFRPPIHKSNCTYQAGIWYSKEDAEYDTNKNHTIIHINMKNNIPPDFFRIIDLDEDYFDKSEKERMIESKFNQLLKVFIFYNDKLRDELKEKYK